MNSLAILDQHINQENKGIMAKILPRFLVGFGVKFYNNFKEPLDKKLKSLEFKSVKEMLISIIKNDNNNEIIKNIIKLFSIINSKEDEGTNIIQTTFNFLLINTESREIASILRTYYKKENDPYKFHIIIENLFKRLLLEPSKNYDSILDLLFKFEHNFNFGKHSNTNNKGQIQTLFEIEINKTVTNISQNTFPSVIYELFCRMRTFEDFFSDKEKGKNRITNIKYIIIQLLQQKNLYSFMKGILTIKQFNGTIDFKEIIDSHFDIIKKVIKSLIHQGKKDKIQEIKESIGRYINIEKIEDELINEELRKKPKKIIKNPTKSSNFDESVPDISHQTKLEKLLKIDLEKFKKIYGLLIDLFLPVFVILFYEKYSNQIPFVDDENRIRVRNDISSNHYEKSKDKIYKFMLDHMEEYALSKKLLINIDRLLDIENNYSILFVFVTKNFTIELFDEHIKRTFDEYCITIDADSRKIIEQLKQTLFPNYKTNIVKKSIGKNIENSDSILEKTYEYTINLLYENENKKEIVSKHIKEYIELSKKEKLTDEEKIKKNKLEKHYGNIIYFAQINPYIHTDIIADEELTKYYINIILKGKNDIDDNKITAIRSLFTEIENALNQNPNNQAFKKYYKILGNISQGLVCIGLDIK